MGGVASIRSLVTIREKTGNIMGDNCESVLKSGFKLGLKFRIKDLLGKRVVCRGRGFNESFESNVYSLKFFTPYYRGGRAGLVVQGYGGTVRATG